MNSAKSIVSLLSPSKTLKRLSACSSELLYSVMHLLMNWGFVISPLGNFFMKSACSFLTLFGFHISSQHICLLCVCIFVCVIVFVCLCLCDCVCVFVFHLTSSSRTPSLRASWSANSLSSSIFSEEKIVFCYKEKHHFCHKIFSVIKKSFLKKNCFLKKKLFSVIKKTSFLPKNLFCNKKKFLQKTSFQIMNQPTPFQLPKVISC